MAAVASSGHRAEALCFVRPGFQPDSRPNKLALMGRWPPHGSMIDPSATRKRQLAFDGFSFSPALIQFRSRAESPAAQSTGLQPCEQGCEQSRPERSPANSTSMAAVAGGPSGRAACCSGHRAKALCFVRPGFQPDSRSKIVSAYGSLAPAFSPIPGQKS